MHTERERERERKRERERHLADGAEVGRGLERDKLNTQPAPLSCERATFPPRGIKARL
jgi:hypothetical protein